MRPTLPVLAGTQSETHSGTKPVPVTPCKNACLGCTGNGACGGSNHQEDPHHHDEPHAPPHTLASQHPPEEHSNILMAEEQVLPTLRRDGSRNWICPSLSKGFYWHRRRWLAYSLIAFFVTLPHLRIQGKPYVLLDIAKRQFTFFGHTFYPTDTPLVACLMLMAFFSIMLVTALAGRVWCGWGCPQTVYLEFLFRPIDRFFNRTIGKGGKSRLAPSGLLMTIKFLVYLVCCLFLAHTFLSYFVGTDRLAEWMRLSPAKHPSAFLVMGGATAGLMLNFLYFREQLCMIACPYGRFQSVMLDRKSYIVAYDSGRGEPRKRGKRETTSDTASSARLSLESLTADRVGDCIECGRCTAVCPTGIDIRDGLQLECIHCAQCVDACDEIMTRVGKPTGLIRYTSQDALAGKPQRLIRARTIIYPAIMLGAMVLFLVILSTKFAFDARVMRMPGSPFSVGSDQHVQNNFRVRLVNRSQHGQEYSIRIGKSDAVARWSNAGLVRLEPGESALVPVDVQFPLKLTSGQGFADTQLQIADTSGATREMNIRLMGPR
jgi:cytochrome c oxidase accessory protein FixG